jgi:hypothetical protein
MAFNCPNVNMSLNRFFRQNRSIIQCVVGLSVATVCGLAADGGWVRGGLTTNAPIWGIEGGLQFALHPGGFTGGTGGPRGLIRLGYPTLTNGNCDLINFIAVEPIVKGTKGYSELEKSSSDQKPGKLFWVGQPMGSAAKAGALDSGEIVRGGAEGEELHLTVHVERFQNGAHVRLKLTQSRNSPNELKITAEAESDSAAIESCILTATMGNKARTRLLFLKEGPISSFQLYPDYKGEQFAPHRIFALGELPRLRNGDVLVSVMNDEGSPRSVEPFGRPGFWDYRGEKVAQYWRKPAGEVGADLTCAVNARFTYWMSKQAIPGGIAFENFELREPFRSGQTFIFGIARSRGGLPRFGDD